VDAGSSSDEQAATLAASNDDPRSRAVIFMSLGLPWQTADRGDERAL
jgi:hypothetical protein